VRSDDRTSTCHEVKSTCDPPLLSYLSSCAPRLLTFAVITQSNPATGTLKAIIIHIRDEYGARWVDFCAQ
jgi:hypothetical protein